MLAAMMLLVGVVFGLHLTEVRSATAITLLSETALSGLVLLELLRTRRRPSWWRSTLLLLLLIVPWFFLFARATIEFAQQPQPFVLFAGPKLLMACMTLMLSRNIWLGVGLTLAVLGESLVLFFALHLSSLSSVSWAEPGQTILYGLLGIALLGLAEERRRASVRALRAETELAALVRGTTIYLALRDQINTPLQTLVVGAGLLAASHGRHADLERAVDELVALSLALPKEAAVEQAGLVGLSLDGAAELSAQTG
jgi:hypothetical protein